MSSTAKLHIDGTHRAISPTQTIEKAHAHLAKMGITRVANVTGLDHLGIPVFNAYRPNSRSLSVSQGKGATSDAAKASAIMEAIESFHAEEINLPLKQASYNELVGKNPLIEVENLPHLIDTKLNREKPIFWIRLC